MKVIEGYEIVERLGTRVFLVARGRRHAALKLLPEDEPDALARCFTAACGASALHHPGIARVYDVGVSAAGGFIVSELLAGESLARRLARGRLPLQRALDITRQLAQILCLVHDNAIVHGALEPDHIILDGNRVQLINVGVAHVLRTAPSYASPEQPASLDDRSDLYALGCLLFAMIAGRPPAELEGPLAAPALVRELVSRLLENNPAERPVSAAVVAAIVDGLSSSAPAGTPRWLGAQAVH